MVRFDGPSSWLPVMRLRTLLGRSLSVKMLVASAVLVLPLSGGYWYRSLVREKQHLTNSAADFAGTLAELVRRSLRESMMHDDRGDIQTTLATIASSDALRTVLIYDRLGRVAFSSNPAEVGRRVTHDERSCLGCHDDPLRPRQTLHEHQRSSVFTNRDGHRVLSYVEPIYNDPLCATAACHAHANGERVLGIMVAEFPLTGIDRRVELQVRDFSVFVLLYIVALGSLGYIALWRVVLRPVRALSDGVEQVASGDMSQLVLVSSNDEIGRLAANFNAMTIELSASRRRMERLTEGLERQVEAKTAEVRRTESRLAEAEKLAALGRLTAEIAHEIRNPLTALGGYARRLQRTVTTEAEKDYARIVVEEATRLEALLKDVLDYSRSSRYDMWRQPLTPIVRGSLESFGERFLERGIRLESTLVAEEEVCVDPVHVRRALDNLLSNAVDASSPGGTVRVATRSASARRLSFVVVAVEDAGPGIADADLGRIFEPFWTTKKLGEGTGLGLPITRKIMEAHGGFIVIANRPDGGLAASLWFPYQDEASLARPPCWEIMRCHRVGAAAPDPCPAWPHFGRACWAVAGTHCEGESRGTNARAIGDCGDCDFFRVMAPGAGG